MANRIKCPYKSGHTVRRRMFVGRGIVEKSGMCGRKYGFGYECAVLWGNFGWTRPPLDIIRVVRK